ncbi:MAG: hypothetical protein M3406_04865 [Chloroflexota bacterium]|nr:hypothetical protein [Chloroflexota bacterium]
MKLFTPSDRAATLARVLDLLEADERIEAAVIAGSVGAGQADRWSDFDIASLVVDAESCERVAASWVGLIYREWDVAHHYETAFGSTLVRGFLLTNALVVDLAFTPIADFEVWAPVRVAFDRTGTATRAAEAWQPWSPTPDWRGEAGFAWHDVLHACVAINRGKPWQALYFLQRVRNRTLALSSERHGLEADEFKYVDALPPGERDALLASLVTDLEREPLLAAIEVAARAFLDELRRGDPALADRLAEPLMLFVHGSQDAGADVVG